jgi:hypothetical protein
MICEILVFKKQLNDELPVIEWDPEEPGIIEAWVDHTDGQKVCVTIDKAFLDFLNESMLDSE